MILDSTSTTLQLLLASSVTTNELPVSVEFVDMTSTTTVPGAQFSTSNGTSAVDIVSAPASSTTRRIIGVQVYNADTATEIVTVRINNGTPYQVIQIALPSNYTLQYTDASGWTTISSSGIVQVAGPTGPAGIAAVAGINDQTGTTYTLVLTDAGKDVRCTNASPITLTIPPNSSVAFPVGTVVLFSQGSTGLVTATAGAGVTIVAAYGSGTTAQYDLRGLEKTDTNTWRVV